MGALVETLVSKYGSLEAVPDDVLEGVMVRAKAPEPAKSTGEKLFGEMGEDAELMDIARAVANIPSSTYQVASDLGTAVMNPIDTAKALGSVGYGAILKGAEAITGDEEGGEEYKAAFKHFINALGERYGGLDNIRRTMVTDPVGFLLDVSPAKTGLAKMGLVKKAGPIGAMRGASRVTEMAGKAGRVALEEGAPTVANLTTGLPVEAFRRGVSASAKNPFQRLKRKFKKPEPEEMTTELDAFDNAMSEAPGFKVADMSTAVERAFREIQDSASDAIGPAKEKLRGKAPKYADLMKKVEDHIEETWGLKWADGDLEAIELVPGLPARQQNSLKRVMETLKKYEADDSLDLWNLHNIALEIDSLAPANARRFKMGNRAWTGVRNIVRKHMEDIDSDWAKASAEYATDMQLMRDIANVFGEADANPATRVTKILQTMSENPKSDMLRRVAELVKQRTGYHLAEAAAGSALSQWIPSGIHARAIALSALGAGGFINPAAFLALPFTVPRLMGELSTRLGMPAAAARKIEKFGADLRSKVPSEWMDLGLNTGTIVNRMLEEGIEPPPFPDFTPTEERLKKGFKRRA